MAALAGMQWLVEWAGVVSGEGASGEDVKRQRWEKKDAAKTSCTSCI